MSKRDRNREVLTSAPASGRSTSDMAPWLARAATLAGVAVLIFMNWTGLKEARDVRSDLGDRLGRVEGQVSQLAAKVDAAARATAPQRGPDPNRAYAIRTDGSPSKGAATAPVVIAEFSDFQ
jgi:hypothetical protein